MKKDEYDNQNILGLIFASYSWIARARISGAIKNSTILKIIVKQGLIIKERYTLVSNKVHVKINCIVALPEGDIATASSDGNGKSSINIYNKEKRYKCTHEIETGHICLLLALISLPNGNLISQSFDRMIMWCGLSNYQSIKELNTDKDFTNLLLLPDNILAVNLENKTVEFWDTNNDDFKYLRTLPVHWGSEAILLQDSNVASSGVLTDRLIYIHDKKKDYQCLKKLKGHDNHIKCLVLLQNGNIASGSLDKTIKVWDCLSGYECIYTLYGHTEWIGNLTMLSDGSLISGDYEILRVWRSINCWGRSKKGFFSKLLGLGKPDYECEKILNIQQGLCKLIILSGDYLAFTDLFGRFGPGNDRIYVWEI
jgi:hypothetical protein